MMITQRALHHLNNLLSFVVIILAFYIIFTPFLPELQYEYQTLAAPREAKAAEQTSIAIPADNRLQIPAIGVDAPILESEDSSVLDNGIWRRPHSSTPDVGGNTVLVGHRYLYTSGSTTFYLLPKLKKGDPIEVYWKGKLYKYTVIATSTVTPQDIWVENPTTIAQLTLYTCTPLWNPTHRFVIKAVPSL